MTATNTPTPSSSAVPWWKHYGAKGLIFPSVVLLVLGGMAVIRLTKAPDTAALAQIAGAAAQQGAQQGAAATPTTAPSTPATVPGYDYLSCSHVAVDDPTPCVPLLVWPLTQGAMELIGYQQGGIKGELSTVKTRLIADQIRNKLPGVDGCSMWLGLERDASMNSILTVYPSQEKAPQGAVKLVNCSPTANATPGTIPTAGAA